MELHAFPFAGDILELSSLPNLWGARDVRSRSTLCDIGKVKVKLSL
jgi:hypothetical protein